MTDQTTIIDVPAAIEFPVASTGRALVPVEQTTSLLEMRAASINRHLDLITKADANGIRHRLRAGQELIAAREHVPPGEWLEWCKANIKARSQRDIQRLMKIAGAGDPEAALEKERAGNRVSKVSSRANATVSRIEAEGAAPASPAELFASIKPTLDSWSVETADQFLMLVADYVNGRNDEIDVNVAAAAEPEPKQPEPDEAVQFDRRLCEIEAPWRARRKERSTADSARLKLLGERAEKNGYRLVSRGSEYHLNDKDSGSCSAVPDLDCIEHLLDSSEGKIASQTCMPCGMPIPGLDNSEAWLAANPGKTIEDFAAALPPPTGCAVVEPEVERPEVNVEAGLSDIERKMALADVEIVGIVAGQPMAQHSAAAATVLRKATKKAGAVIRPDLAAFAADRGMPVSANAAA